MYFVLGVEVSCWKQREKKYICCLNSDDEIKMRFGKFKASI